MKVLSQDHIQSHCRLLARSIWATCSTPSGIWCRNPNWWGTRSGRCFFTISKQISGVLSRHIWEPSLQISGKVYNVLAVYGFQILHDGHAHLTRFCRIASPVVEFCPMSSKHSTYHIIW